MIRIPINTDGVVPTPSQKTPHPFPESSRTPNQPLDDNVPKPRAGHTAGSKHCAVTRLTSSGSLIDTHSPRDLVG